MAIRLLTASDATAYRALMLAAYTQAPEAFTSTAEERAGQPLSWWERRIASADGLTQGFGAFDATDALVGTVALEYSAKPKTAHMAHLIGMYVQPTSRRAGTGRALVQAALAAAAVRAGVCIVKLEVTDGNTAAEQLYEACGFVTWGVQPCALRMPNDALNNAPPLLRAKRHMQRVFSAPPPAAG
jgi:GNAT superfamily N-acetyltransferase